jgi:hypothetical protein
LGDSICQPNHAIYLITFSVHFQAVGVSGKESLHTGFCEDLIVVKEMQDFIDSLEESVKPIKFPPSGSRTEKCWSLFKETVGRRSGFVWADRKISCKLFGQTFFDVQLTTAAPLLVKADELDLLGVLEASSDKVLPLIATAIDLAPSLLPLAATALKTRPQVMFGGAGASFITAVALRFVCVLVAVCVCVCVCLCGLA